MDVGVALRFEAASGHAAAGAAEAMKQEGFVFVRGDGFDAVGDFIERQVHSAGEAAGVEFLGRTDVDNDRALGEKFRHLRGGDSSGEFDQIEDKRDGDEGEEDAVFQGHTERAWVMKARTLSRSLMPGEDSTPEATSMAAGRV